MYAYNISYKRVGHSKPCRDFLYSDKNWYNCTTTFVMKERSQNVIKYVQKESFTFGLRYKSTAEVEPLESKVANRVPQDSR